LLTVAHCSERYDARQNVHDYDFHLRLADAPGGTLVHAAHFRAWRDTGQAYQFRDASCPAPNRSLASEVHGQVVAARDRNGKELGRQACMHRLPVPVIATYA
jgi:DNA-binding FadR family transcriptional regulator